MASIVSPSGMVQRDFLRDDKMGVDVYGGKLFEEKCNASASRRPSQLWFEIRARVHRASHHVTEMQSRPVRHARVRMTLAASWRDAVSVA